MASPQIWGPHMWKTIHYIALGYPMEKPSTKERKDYKEFYMNLHKVLPCFKCAENYSRHLEEVPSIEGYLDSSSKLFEWTWLLHNIVNKDLGKGLITLAAAKAMYMKNPSGDHTNIIMSIAIVGGILLLLFGWMALRKLKCSNK